MNLFAEARELLGAEACAEAERVAAEAPELSEEARTALSVLLRRESERVVA